MTRADSWPRAPAFFLQNCLQIEDRLVGAEELLDIRLNRVASADKRYGHGKTKILTNVGQGREKR